MSKLFGVLDTKFQNNKRKFQFIANLSSSEKKRLFLEGVITTTAMIMIYFGCMFLFRKLVYPQPEDFTYQWDIVQKMSLTPEKIEFYKLIFTVGMIVVSLWFVRWRLSRRYRYFELNHILQELDYIAKGNYHHRISTDLGSLRMVHVVSSINQLVNSTVQAMEEERRVEQTKHELITNISHDIRTPLTSIIGYLGLLEESIQDIPQDLRQYIQIAYSKSQQMKRLTDNLFEYMRMQDNQEVLNYKKISLLNFLNQIAAEYEQEAVNHDVQIIVDVPDDLNWSIDPDKMVRVYDNLLSNAFKYANASKIYLRGIYVNNQLQLIVENNGHKISEEAIEFLFNRFYREEKSRSSQTGGSGLGLAIVERIVALHGGEVYVDSSDSSTKFMMIFEV